ncbi:MAG: glutamate 5-kinase [Gammaproteobacteria bacterium]|jgi:glutamate 5-kinase|nr:glutamate 5-kinase [Gammaproteobacteria bacterium]MBT3489390.1 glutamate 5-kinase [Gammaproteobacteria bacterium]MBT3718319.1 glutamate 5-kinase [Gammaproteobacteria bacterium]MBT3844052.1 glutamate 5-kinase [Gammaproteobacteria bacterium]MBT3892196.1 glutamate 5-kinase [Gammaproteobacteria bacterium]
MSKVDGNPRMQISNAKLAVIKFGSAILTNDGEGLATEAIRGWVEQIVSLRQSGVNVILVSSGAVAEGMKRLGMDHRPHAIHELQAAAAVGQTGLVQAYEACFSRHQLHTAQILLTHDDLSNRQRYLNARSAIRTLLEMGVVPIVNENDTVAIDEIRLGDNDTLAALVANLIEADLLVILTDQQGMYDADPRSNPEAQLLQQVEADDPQLDQMAGAVSGVLGRGGMETKVKAARLAARSGTATIIAPGRVDGVLVQIFQQQMVGTLFLPGQQQLVARKRWLLGQLQMCGSLVVDGGAANVLRGSGRSLLAVGIRSVEGRFQRGDLVSLKTEKGEEVARGLVNYSAEDIRKIAGQSSDRIEGLLGYVDEEEVVHRDNMVVIQQR